MDRPEKTIRHAAEILRQRAVPDLKLAPLYRTEPVDCPPGTAPFVNTAGVGGTHLTPNELLAVCKHVETIMGRPADHGRNQPRPVDIDILLINDLHLSRTGLIVPHPRLCERLFVLIPLADIAPDWIVPGTGKTVRKLADEQLAAQPPGWGRRIH
jgi:2-amino-4-hydroxy-6-hydroxymethyldihydropteridine diphosphokinase